MSDPLKHECGIAFIRLLKPLEYYKKKYGTAFYGVNKMYLMLEKQHNRGQDGAGFASIKLDMQPGQRYISRVRSNQQSPIQDVFKQINNRINEALQKSSDKIEDVNWLKENVPYIGECFLGHIRYGTHGKNGIESVHPFLRQNNWMHRNLIVAGNFNMTNNNVLFNNLIRIGQHPKDNVDTITVMEKIGHFLDREVSKLYKKLKQEGFTKKEASPEIAKRLNLCKILKKASKHWDGGYAMAGMIGHGDAFVLRDPAGIRPAYYYKDDEVVVVASERPAIQTVFNVPVTEVKELPAGNAILIKKDGETSIKEINEPLERKACSFERIYFSRGNDSAIYKERKALGASLAKPILSAIGNDLKNTVFSFIPNTAETSFYGMIESMQDELNQQKLKTLLQLKDSSSEEELTEILSPKIRVEKLAIKDAKLRTFITEGSSRDDLVAHIYDVTYGVVQPKDSLVVIDDSIVRGTTLKKSILKMLDRLNPKKIIIVSSAPQIRYPDCYGIDMANLEGLIAFRATLELLKEDNMYHIVDAIYQKCKAQTELEDSEVVNYVKDIYSRYTPEQINEKIAELLKGDVKAEVKIIFQSIGNLHKACPENLGDWYFTGDYPTDGGNRVVNRAFINFYEGIKERAY